MNLRRLLAFQPFSPPVFLGACAIALVIVAVIILTVANGAREAAEAKVDAAMSEARGKSAAEATNTVAAGADRDAATDATTRENSNAIDKAPGAGQAVDPGVNDAGLRSLCKRAANRGRPECVQLLGPVELPEARSRR